MLTFLSHSAMLAFNICATNSEHTTKSHLLCTNIIFQVILFVSYMLCYTYMCTNTLILALTSDTHCS